MTGQRKDSSKSLPAFLESARELELENTLPEIQSCGTVIHQDDIDQSLRSIRDHLIREHSHILDMHEHVPIVQIPPTPTPTTGSWERKTFFCKTVDSRLLRFIIQATVSLTVMSVSISQLIVNQGDTLLWSSLLSFTIGLWFPNPNLRDQKK